MGDLEAIAALREDVQMMGLMANDMEDVAAKLPFERAKALLRVIEGMARDNAILSEERDRLKDERQELHLLVGKGVGALDAILLQRTGGPGLDWPAVEETWEKLREAIRGIRG